MTTTNKSYTEIKANIYFWLREVAYKKLTGEYVDEYEFEDAVDEQFFVLAKFMNVDTLGDTMTRRLAKIAVNAVCDDWIGGTSYEAHLRIITRLDVDGVMDDVVAMNDDITLECAH